MTDQINEANYDDGIIWRPGDTAPDSGQYGVWDDAGAPVLDDDGQQIEITLNEGRTFPPTDRRGMYYRMADLTRHKRRRR